MFSRLAIRAASVALAIATGITFSITACVERFPPEVYECLVNCNP